MTEAEAKTKWCPQARVGGSVGTEAQGTSTNRWHHQPISDVQAADYRCIGSACMAWRWSESKRTAAFLEAVQAHMQRQSKPNFNTAVQAVYAETGGRFERVEGLCGLAGKPE